ncbi:MAG: iron chelate uptake ABC transporter family permease subunit [Eggerthellaceae bacterium]|nr:iron chelate uptake ABC transporter family permease subunit [Eggerthellaceae bacterium]
MASGSSKKRKNSDYIFIDGHAIRSDEVIHIDLGTDSSTIAPGQNESVSVPGAEQVQDKAQSTFKRVTDTLSDKGEQVREKVREDYKRLEQDDAFAFTDDVLNGEMPFARTEALMKESKKKIRTKYIITGAILAVVALASLCISSGIVGTYHTPLEIIKSIGAWFEITFTQIFNPSYAVYVNRQISIEMPYYSDCILQIWIVFRNLACGALLAVSGMLYQNTFSNSLAAPSMLGLTNGINFALLILVLMYGYQAIAHTDEYYIFSAIGGVAILILVMAGGKFISGKGQLNVVNMILMGTILSQLLGILITYIQAIYMDDAAWDAYYILQNGTAIRTGMTYAILIIGGLVALIPIVLFRFKLNLISFSESESKLLGVNPNRLRLLALACGSLMILIGQMLCGQVAMVSLIIPFIVRAIYGSEMRKQLAGNLLVGALLLVVCGDFGSLITIDGLPIGLSMVASIVALPLFIWMLAIRQRSWS